MAASLEIPEVRALDLAIGFHAQGAAPGDSVLFSLVCDGAAGSASVTRGFDMASGNNAWHEVRIAAAPLGPGKVDFTLAMATTSDRPDLEVEAAWSGFDLVVADCSLCGTDSGYSVDVPSGVRHLSVTLESQAAEVPLDIIQEGGRGLRYWVGTRAKGLPRQVVLDVWPSGGEVLVRSDSAFTMSKARAVHMGKCCAAFDLIHSGDMLIFENFGAAEKGICVGREHASIEGSGSDRRLRVASLDIEPEMRCGSATITSYEPERVTVETDCETDGYLIFQDLHYPGWTAAVDGIERDLLRTDFAVRAVEVPAGKHSVMMEFRPESLRQGLILSLVGISGLACYILLNVLRMRGPKRA
jgi:hypothetical protein